MEELIRPFKKIRLYEPRNSIEIIEVSRPLKDLYEAYTSIEIRKTNKRRNDIIDSKDIVTKFPRIAPYNSMEIRKTNKRRNDVIDSKDIVTKFPRIEPDKNTLAAILIQRYYRGWSLRRNLHLLKFLFYK